MRVEFKGSETILHLTEDETKSLAYANLNVPDEIMVEVSNRFLCKECALELECANGSCINDECKRFTKTNND